MREARCIIFVREGMDNGPICEALRESLLTAEILGVQVFSIFQSTEILMSHKYQNCESLYHNSCYKHIAPKEFWETHYEWIIKQVRRIYGTQPDLQGFYDFEDCLSDSFLFLPRILAKFDHQCNLRTFVYNRLRGYLAFEILKQCRVRLAELYRVRDGLL